MNFKVNYPFKRMMVVPLVAGDFMSECHYITLHCDIKSLCQGQWLVGPLELKK